jgi:pyruvate ferredoxin oxidoreductase gamma subunit
MIEVRFTNTTMLGSLVKAKKIVELVSLDIPTKNRFGLIAQKNINALTRAFNET